MANTALSNVPQTAAHSTEDLLTFAAAGNYTARTMIESRLDSPKASSNDFRVLFAAVERSIPNSASEFELAPARSALQCLRGRNKFGAEEIILRAAEHGNEELKADACRTLLTVGTQQSTPFFTRQLEQPIDGKLKSEIALYLCRLGDEAPHALLAEFVQANITPKTVLDPVSNSSDENHLFVPFLDRQIVARDAIAILEKIDRNYGDRFHSKEIGAWRALSLCKLTESEVAKLADFYRREETWINTSSAKENIPYAAVQTLAPYIDSDCVKAAFITRHQRANGLEQAAITAALNKAAEKDSTLAFCMHVVDTEAAQLSTEQRSRRFPPLVSPEILGCGFVRPEFHKALTDIVQTKNQALANAATQSIISSGINAPHFDCDPLFYNIFVEKCAALKTAPAETPPQLPMTRFASIVESLRARWSTDRVNPPEPADVSPLQFTKLDWLRVLDEGNLWYRGYAYSKLNDAQCTPVELGRVISAARKEDTFNSKAVLSLVTLHAADPAVRSYLLEHFAKGPKEEFVRERWPHVVSALAVHFALPDVRTAFISRANSIQASPDMETVEVLCGRIAEPSICKTLTNLLDRITPRLYLGYSNPVENRLAETLLPYSGQEHVFNSLLRILNCEHTKDAALMLSRVEASLFNTIAHDGAAARNLMGIADNTKPIPGMSEDLAVPTRVNACRLLYRTLLDEEHALRMLRAVVDVGDKFRQAGFIDMYGNGEWDFGLERRLEKNEVPSKRNILSAARQLAGESHERGRRFAAQLLVKFPE